MATRVDPKIGSSALYTRVRNLWSFKVYNSCFYVLYITSCTCVVPWRWPEFRVEISFHKSKYYFGCHLLFHLSHCFMFFWFHFFITVYMFVSFCMFLFKFVNYILLLLCLCILTVCVLCSVWSVFTCQLAPFGYPDWDFSVLFFQLWGKCQGITRKDGARSALFPISLLTVLFLLLIVLFCC